RLRASPGEARARRGTPGCPRRARSASASPWRPMLLGGEKQVIVRLSALLDVDLEVGMRVSQPLEEPVEVGSVSPDEHRQEAARLGEQPLDDAAGNLVEAPAAGHRLAVGEAEPVPLRNRETVQTHVAR